MPSPSSALTDQMIDQLYRQKASPGLTCVPYARNRTGVALRGDAYTWWDGAEGNYQRGHLPQPGAILVLSRTGRLQSGHVAVVSQVVSAREILVDHANWVPGETITGMPVVDVSEQNDWTILRFWYAPARSFGSPYAAEGFIYPAAVPPAGPPAIGPDPIAELIRDQE
ncbi:CHAP domain-containing protein [Dongia soli]|uniref:CHAP domain-containing protein n=1 Tax=Dongia soli TaxID=600628 RepID=A0ABU5E9E6_9PROT|nr:CHAP domain-containing protein [Dongia soli]MDY0882854.1 CHAP domain-containing protein [Dongia soli]